MISSNKIQKSAKTINNHMFLLFMIVIFLFIFIPNSVTYKNYIITAMGLLSFFFTLLDNKNNKRIFILPIILSVTFLLSFFITRNASIQEILWILIYFTISLTFIDNKKLLLDIKILLYIVLGSFLFLSVFNFNPNTVFYGTSRNIVSAISLFVLAIYLLICYNFNKPFSKIPILIFAIACYWAIGRTGVILAVMTLIIFVFVDNKNYSFKFDYKFLIFSIIIVIVLINQISIINNFEKLTSSVSMKLTSGESNQIKEQKLLNSPIKNITDITIDNDAVTNFEGRAMGSPRFEMWIGYYNSCLHSFKSFFWGVERANHPDVYLYGENLHNAFFILHSKTGILGFLTIGLLLLNSFIYMIKNKKYFPIIILILIGIRSMMDWVGFFGYYDIIYYYFIIEFSDYNKYTKKIKSRLLSKEKQSIGN